MKFLLTLHRVQGVSLPINYQYPLSAAVYKILDNADGEYAHFLHQRGYGKGFKLFNFSDIQGKFKLQGDRLNLLADTVTVTISFHLPEASQNFIKGLFMSQHIGVADSKSKVTFVVSSVEALLPIFQEVKDNEIINIKLKTASACVAGMKNEVGNYVFLSPEDPRFSESLLFNWKEKIRTVYPQVDTDQILLSVETLISNTPPKSRLTTIKSGTLEETKIRGWKNFGLQLTGEKKYVELLYNSGVGLYNAMGCGCVEVVKNGDKN
ncbi:CRISPR-associated endoribonuclease Cas6 [Chryseobacterium lacus]|uniref:CRISPR-associated endoribonuclease Cas6 n=1 Tax=Chryseobacterium lacus TaxID=2058346 RepID=UPI000F865E87|nr:CRISPR-associated endoribonuclease Cas6 [Chryseobacterium lacus]RST26079.1 CRISPR-associated endoribonuclease Cas6 [Chryseobacterium lacus]